MAEVGIDITDEFPKPWTDEIVARCRRRRHHGLRRRLPALPGKRYEDWELDDPARQDVARVRPIRDEIRTRVESLITSLTGARGDSSLTTATSRGKIDG
jgi:protein-tyrosine-phosphatase